MTLMVSSQLHCELEASLQELAQAAQAAGAAAAEEQVLRAPLCQTWMVAQMSLNLQSPNKPKARL